MKNIVIKSIISTALLAATGVTLAQSGPANAYGFVISSTPVLQQVTVPKQVCTTTTVQYVQPNGGGALIGAVIGGALGNQIGRGHGQDGRAVATVIGALGGGLVGNQIETHNYSGQYPTQSCHTKNTVENRTVAQNVLYEYAGQRYTVQMPAEGSFRQGAQIALYIEAPVQTVTYTQPTYLHSQPTFAPIAPIVYYTGFDHFAPRYISSEPYYRHSYVRPHAPRAAQQPVYNPVRQVRRDYGYEDYRNWR